MSMAQRKPEDSQSAARGSSFYAAMRIMPPHARDAMYEIYAFCRAIDDIADNEGPAQERLQQLQQWRRDMAQLYAGTAPIHLSGLAAAIASYGLREQDFLAVIDGMEMDVLGPIQAPAYETLLLYCDRVASAVGRLSVRVFGIDEIDGLTLAKHLGLALQLTNILRDIDEDAALNRLYLPKELLVEAGIHGHDPVQILENPALVQVCAKLAAEASIYFHEADVIMNRCERKRVRTPRVMSQAYQALHAGLVQRGFTSPRKKVRLNKMKLGVILARNVFF